MNEVGSDMTLEDYRAVQVRFHMDLMKVCRRYINELDIVSILGIIDIVKRETIDLEGATNLKVGCDEFQKSVEGPDSGYF